MTLTVLVLCAQTYVQTERVEKVYTPEELIRYITPFTIATAKAVAAGNSCKQEDVIVAANMGRKSVYDVLHACKVRTTTVTVSSRYTACMLDAVTSST